MSLAERLVISLAQPGVTLSFDDVPPLAGSDILAEVEIVAAALREARLDGPLTVQLPTSPLAVVMHLAALVTGTLVQHMPVSFGATEVAGILDAVRPARLITCREDVGRADVVRALCAKVLTVSQLEHASDLVPDHHTRADAFALARDLDDRLPALLLPTSGSTGAPKVAAHSQRSLEAAADMTAKAVRLSQDDIFFSPSPPTHITGLLLGIHLPLLHGAGTAFQSRWDPARALALIQRRGCTFSSAIPTFVIDLYDEWRRTGGPFLRKYLIGGADVPTERIMEIERETGCVFMRSYGGTEAPMLTLFHPEDDPDLRLTADGVVLPPGRIESTGGTEVGELLIRAPAQALGYYWRGELRPLSADGWLSLGDEGTVSPEGVLRMSGRLKDVIVRGGVKFYTPELDAVIRSLPRVADAAVFGVEDARLGQVPAVAIVPEPDEQAPTVEELAEQLTARSFGHQKHPVAVLVVDDIPRTPTGKVDRGGLQQAYAGWTKA